MGDTAFIAKKVLLTAACYMQTLFHGRPVHVPNTISKILVIHMAKLGDMVCTTPVFRAIKAHDSDIEVHVMGNKINREVVEGNNDIDKYVVFTGFEQARSAIKEGAYDAVLIAGAPDIASLTAAILADVRCIVAPSVRSDVSPLGDVWYRAVSKLVIGMERKEGEYAPGAYVKMLEPLGISASNTKKYVYFSEAGKDTARKYIQQIAAKGLIVGMTPSAGNKIKEWPPERFASLAEYLVSAYGAAVIVFGAKSDAREIEAMMGAIQNKKGIHNALEQFSIDELKAVISCLHLFISADTGPIYLAEAQDIPTIDIVGPVDEREQPPIGEKHRVVVPERTKPVLTVMNAKWYDCVEARRQAEATSVEQVIEEVDSLLFSLGYSKIAP